MTRLESIFGESIIKAEVLGERRVKIKLKGLYNKDFLVKKLDSTFKYSEYVVNKVRWNFITRSTKIDIKLTSLDKKLETK